MKLGVALRSMGPQSSRETFLACARAAEQAGLDDLWVQDHLAIPPDDLQRVPATTLVQAQDPW